jgi:large subunit ribosomal protein L24
MKRPTSQQARKQRKYLAKAPAHARHKMVSAQLDKELREKYKRGSLPVRKGDKVKIMRGDMKGHSGEVTKVDLKKYKIYMQGLTAKKADGTDVEKPIHPSNVRITELYEDDKERRQTLMKKTEAK